MEHEIEAHGTVARRDGVRFRSCPGSQVMCRMNHENLWAEALAADAAPRVFMRSTHAAALEHVDFADLKAYALDLS